MWTGCSAEEAINTSMGVIHVCSDKEASHRRG